MARLTLGWKTVTTLTRIRALSTPCLPPLRPHSGPQRCRQAALGAGSEGRSSSSSTQLAMQTRPWNLEPVQPLFPPCIPDSASCIHRDEILCCRNYDLAHETTSLRVTVPSRPQLKQTCSISFLRTFTYPPSNRLHHDPLVHHHPSPICPEYCVNMQIISSSIR